MAKRTTYKAISFSKLKGNCRYKGTGIGAAPNDCDNDKNPETTAQEYGACRKELCPVWQTLQGLSRR